MGRTFLRMRPNPTCNNTCKFLPMYFGNKLPTLIKKQNWELYLEIAFDRNIVGLRRFSLDIYISYRFFNYEKSTEFNQHIICIVALESNRIFDYILNRVEIDLGHLSL